MNQDEQRAYEGLKAAYRSLVRDLEKLEIELEITQAALREAVLGFIGYAFPEDDPDEIVENVLSGFMQSGRGRRAASSTGTEPAE